MTTPPRLPIREKSTAASERAGHVSPMLTRLAADRATGSLVREGGTLHLADGHVVHAESPSAPDADALLSGGPAGAGPVARGALEMLHLCAFYDAAYFVLAPSGTPGRFHHGTPHAAGVVPPVPVAALEREILRRRALLRRVWPDPAPDTAALLRTDAARAPAPTPRQRAVLALVDGVRTAPDIARELGRPAFHTLVDVRRLVAAGTVTAARTAPAGGHPAAADATPATGRPPPTSDSPTATAVTAMSAMSAALPVVTDPDITLLKRLRDALEAL